MIKSIRWQITIPYFFLAILCLGGLTWYFSNQMRDQNQRIERDRLILESQLIASQLGNQFSASSVEELNAQADSYAKKLQTRVTIIDITGKVLGDSETDSTRLENHLNRPEVKAAIDGQSSWAIRFSQTLLSNQLYTASPIIKNGKTVGVARLSVSLASVQANLANFQRNLLLIAVLILILMLGTAFYFSENTLRPIRQLTSAAAENKPGRFVSGTILDRRDEIGHLSRALNQMSEKLDKEYKELEGEQEKLYTILASMSDGVLIVDGLGNVQLINPAACILFNVQEAQCIGHTLTEIARHHLIVDLWKKTRETNEQQNLSFELGAEKVFLQVIVTPMGGLLKDACLLVFQDLTRIHKLETVRQDFVSNVSHELRTPLASIKSLAETLDDGALEDETVARRFLGMMSKEIDSMTQIIEELLQLSRLETGRIPLQKHTVSMEDLLEPVLDRMNMLATKAGLVVSLELASDLPEVELDVDRMQQVIINLLHNAIKFTPAGGKIEVITTELKNHIQIEIRDTGVGISQEDLPRIFERFYKADRARSGGGTGLGLSIAKHIVESHNGKIWAESQEGVGASFFITLPKVQAD
jgi:two-component system, OmpR family, phosphate regulon sensor histidine kinase PhoR